MKSLSTLVSLLCLMLPAVASAGNSQPTLYLEAYSSADIPTSPAPSYICSHGEQSGGTFHCYAEKAPLSFLYLVVHVDKLDATCPYSPGSACADYGGYRVLSFGMQASGEPAVFTCVFPCAGFMMGPSTAGWPAAIVVATVGSDPGYDCRDRWDNPCYLGFFNNSGGTGATHFALMPSADDEPGAGYSKTLVNCAHQFDPGTVIGCNAQWGGTQANACLALVPVRATTWGAIKSMYR